MKVRSRAPLRLGLAGGGTDIKSFSNLYGGRVVNVTIAMYAHTTIEKNNKISFIANDVGKRELYLKSNLVKKLDHKGLFLHRETYKFIMKKYNKNKYINLKIITSSDVPPGSGLGSSSTLVVSMIKCYVELLNLSLDNHQIAEDAIHIERIICKIDGGKQDQFAASYGGFNVLEFNKEKTYVYPLSIKNFISNEFEESVTLYYTGVSRKSSDIIVQQNKKINNNNSISLKAMHNLKKESFEFVDHLIKGDFAGLYNSFNKGWENKIKTSNFVANSNIKKIMNYAKKNGALAGKISGAGGGGFMMFFSKPENRYNLQKMLLKKGGKIYNCHLSFKGCEAWKV